jgi:hypothetical protein
MQLRVREDKFEFVQERPNGKKDGDKEPRMPSIRKETRAFNKSLSATQSYLEGGIEAF